MQQFATAAKILSVAVASACIVACSFGTSRSSSGQYTEDHNNDVPQESTQNESILDLDPISVNSENFYEVSSLSLKALLVADSTISVLDRTGEVTRINAGIFGTASGVNIDVAPLDCEDSGTIKIQGQVTGEGGVNQPISFENSLLWTLSTQFQNCAQAGNSITGKVSASFDMNLTELLNSSRYAFVAKMNVDNVLMVEQGQNPMLINGDFSYSIENYDSVNSVTNVTTSSTTYLDGNGLQTFDYQLEKSYNADTEIYIYSIASTFTAESIESEYLEYRTIQPLSGKGRSYPTSGKIMVFGTDSFLYITALENQMVMMELDEDQDGNVDFVEFATWDDLVLDVTQDVHIE